MIDLLGSVFLITGLVCAFWGDRIYVWLNEQQAEYYKARAAKKKPNSDWFWEKWK